MPLLSFNPMPTPSLPTPDLVRRIDFSTAEPAARPGLFNRQWLVTNGLGGYASGTLSGAVTWRYHGLLIAALPAPRGRTLMLNHLEEWLKFPNGRAVQIGGTEPEPGKSHAPECLLEFRLENQIPHWRYEFDGVVLEKRVLMPNLQNTVQVNFTLISGIPGLRLELRPSLNFRRFEDSVSTPLNADYEVRCRGRRFEIDSHQDCPPLRLSVLAPRAEFIQDRGSVREINYLRDAERGYDSVGSLWSPGFFSIPADGGTITLVASTEDWRTIEALKPDEAFETEQARVRRILRKAPRAARSGVAASLVLAADQFIISPTGRINDAARARAEGDELRSVIAGYHWFTDWGRDTMISLEGLSLTTGRYQEAAWILRTFARHVRDGLIPNLFPEGENQGLYHTADATLWFFQAVHRYVTVTGDPEMLLTLLPVFRDIIDHHLRGTKFGIGVDAADGLLRQGEQGYQLTWMDAKVGDWVVTPRRGKAVEINALWYNALRLMEGWLKGAGAKPEAEIISGHANRAAESFNRRFWNASTGGLYDVVDGENGDDPAIRPNQIFAISLPNPILAREHWPAVLATVEKHLLTPVGLRTLSPDHPDYKPKYTGDLRSRDAAYHQGTVWPWLIGNFIDAWLKVNPGNPAEARRFVADFAPHLDEACVGSISEIFDAESPFLPRGCIAQAWSVAEVLRSWVLTTKESDLTPPAPEANGVPLDAP
jgi:predicted glycogen debranching enzyme